MTANCSVWLRLGFSHRRVCIQSVWHGGVVNSPQLPAGGVDVGAPVAPHSDVDAELYQPIPEGGHPGRGSAAGREAGCWIERDQVDVGAEETGERGQLGRIGPAIVD